MLPGEQIVLVLVEPQDAVNVGGVIRVMLNFGLQRLRLVRPAPVALDPSRLDDVAHRSGEIVRHVDVFDSLAAALADVTFAAGTTARPRTTPGPTTTPRAAAPVLLQQANIGQLALVFGPEDTGLGNAGLDLCHLVLTIPTAPDYRSLNLAQAALLVCYELWLEHYTPTQSGPAHQTGVAHLAPGGIAAPLGDLEDLFADTTHALQAVGFLKAGQETMIMRRLRGLVHRALPTAEEVSLLRAMAREINKYVERTSP